MDVKSFITLTPGAEFTTRYFLHKLQIGPNKLECIDLASTSGLDQCSLVSQRNYTIVDHLKAASLGQAPALLANIRLG
jgi:hypothetical protein